MLGVTRQSVTIVAEIRQRAGMIEYKRGEISVLIELGWKKALASVTERSSGSTERP